MQAAFALKKRVGSGYHGCGTRRTAARRRQGRPSQRSYVLLLGAMTDRQVPALLYGGRAAPWCTRGGPSVQRYTWAATRCYFAVVRARHCIATQKGLNLNPERAGTG